MKERKYKYDWANEERIDGRTGKEKLVPVYRGSWFELPPDQEKSPLLLKGLVPWAAFLALLLLYFLLDFPGATVMYVFLPAALGLFPCLYWVLGLWAFFRAPARMTRVRKENGPGRVFRSAVGCTIFAFMALVGEAVALLSGGADPTREWPGTLMLLAAALCAVFTASVFRAAVQSLRETGGNSP